MTQTIEPLWIGIMFHLTSRKIKILVEKKICLKTLNFQGLAASNFEIACCNSLPLLMATGYSYNIESLSFFEKNKTKIGQSISIWS